MFRKVQDLTDPKRSKRREKSGINGETIVWASLSAFEQDPMWQRSKNIFASFPELLAKEDTHEFTMRFLEAQALQLKHGRCLHPPPVMPDTLPVDILFYVFKFLTDPRDFCALMRTCKYGFLWQNTTRSHYTTGRPPFLIPWFDRAWNSMLRSGYVWKDLYARLGLGHFIWKYWSLIFSFKNLGIES